MIPSIILSAILLVLSYPDFNFGFLAWFGLVPLLSVIEGRRPLEAFLICYAAGALFFLGTIYWLIHVTLPGMVIVALYLAVYFGMFGLLACSLRGASCTEVVMVIPAMWVATEWARSHFLTGFGWALLGHSQTYYLPLIQIADITGAYGVSYLVVMVNTALFLAVRGIHRKGYSAACVAIPLAFLFVTFSYGTFRMKNVFAGDGLKVAVVQGNIPQSKKWDPAFQEEILKKYERLTLDASGKGPDLIIWPETSVPGFLEADRGLFDRITGLAKKAGAYMLAGAPRESGENRDSYFNSATLISPDGTVAGRYDKIHLVPFGEYVPLKNIFSFVERFAPSPIGDFSKGGDYAVFGFFMKKSSAGDGLIETRLKKIKFSALVCFEDIFPEMSRRFVQSGALFLVNITNDAWFGLSSAPGQHTQSSVFRAVENRVNVVRAANTGISCFIDQKGRIMDVVGENGKKLFVDGFRVREIFLARTRTFYTLHGDVFAYLCILVSGIYVIRRKRAMEPDR